MYMCARSSCVHGHTAKVRAYVYVYEYVSHVLQDEDASFDRNRIVQPSQPNKATTWTKDWTQSTYPVETKARDGATPGAHHMLFFGVRDFGGRKGKGRFGIKRCRSMRLARGRDGGRGGWWSQVLCVRCHGKQEGKAEKTRRRGVVTRSATAFG
jgi:hypothetical protein